MESVKKTRRILIADEDYPRCSVATDISALVGEKAFDYLDAPPRRVCPPHSPVPYSIMLERLFAPTKEKNIRGCSRGSGGVMASSSIKSDRRISYLRALNETLDQEMGRDPSVILYWERM